MNKKKKKLHKRIEESIHKLNMRTSYDPKGEDLELLIKLQKRKIQIEHEN